MSQNGYGTKKSKRFKEFQRNPKVRNQRFNKSNRIKKTKIKASKKSKKPKIQHAILRKLIN